MSVTADSLIAVQVNDLRAIARSMPGPIIAQAADLRAIVQDLPCTLTSGQHSIVVTAGEVDTMPEVDGRGLTEAGAIIVVGALSDLQTLGGLKIAGEVGLTRYGQATPLPCTVASLRVDEVGFTVTLVPRETRRESGVVI